MLKRIGAGAVFAAALTLAGSSYLFMRGVAPRAQKPEGPAIGKNRAGTHAISASTQTHRNLGKAYYEQGKYTEAVDEFRKVIAAGQALSTDHLDLGLALLQNNENDKALGELTTAHQMDTALVAADYGLGILFKRELRYPDAEAALGRVIHADPNDPAAWFNLGDVYQAERKFPESLAAFQHVDEMGFGRGQNFYVASLFHTFTILIRMKRQPEAKPYLEMHEKLRDRVPSISIQNPALEGGKYGAIIVPVRAAVRSPSPPPEASWDDVTSKLGLKFSREPGEVPPNALGAAVTLWAPSVAIGDYDGDGRSDVYVVNPSGPSRLFRQNPDGTFTDVTDKAGLAGAGGTVSATFADYDNSGHLSLFVAGVNGVRLYKNHGDGTFSDETEKAGLKMPSGLLATDAVLFDADNDGFLDLVVTVYGSLDELIREAQEKVDRGSHAAPTPVASFFFRNNGDGTFTDATSSSGLATAKGRMRGALFADFDNDGYADLLFYSDDGPPILFMNRGEDKFVDRTHAAGKSLADVPALDARAVDFNHDGNFDLVLWTKEDARILLNNGHARFTPDYALPQLTAPSGLFDSRGTVADLDGDGFDDLLNLDAEGKLHFLRNAGGRFTETPAGLKGRASEVSLARVTAAPLASPGKLDLLGFTKAGELMVLEKTGPPSHWLEVKLDGSKSNTQGVGAVVEIKAGNYYRKVLATGGPVIVYTGKLAQFDVVRVTWPNAIVQNSIHVPADKTLSVRESERLASSCPFLYAWDGAKFVFVTDVLGMAPIGELAPDGTRIPPHPEEFVRLPDTLRAEKDEYVFQLTDELREVDYFDQLKLVAVDHPAADDVYSNEIYSSAPSEPALYEVAEKLLPLSATDDHGHDVLGLITHADGRYPSDFRQSRIPGLADLHSLTLDLGEFPQGKSVSLWLKGWVFWTDSNASRALETNKSVALVPPYLQVPDAQGRWVTVIPDMGLPSGTNRTMRVDLTGRFPSHDHRVRIVTNLCAFWDQVFFTMDDRRVMSAVDLPLVAADLHYRGFSAPVSDPSHLVPDSFEYASLLDDAPWNPMAGNYTRYGEVRPLLEAQDDRLVVMATGDELTARFSARNLAPLKPGWTRTFFLYTAGYAKDGEPNTAASKTVAPLPFRRMPNYPYGPRDGHPRSASERLYIERYETRPAYLLIPPLAPSVQ